MSLNEVGHGAEELTAAQEAAAEAQEREAVQAETKPELKGLEQETEIGNWPDVPELARNYLQKNARHCLPLAIAEARKSLAEDPTVFDDPDVAEFELDGCIEAAVKAGKLQKTESDTSEIATQTQRAEVKNAENAAKSSLENQKLETIATNQEANDQRNTRNVVQTEKKAGREGLVDLMNNDPAFKNLKGEALLNALLAHDTVTGQPELVEYLGGIQMKLNQIRQLASTPEEATALNAIIASSALYLGGNNQMSVFSDVLGRMDSSPSISEATKQNVHKLFGVPTVETGGDIQNTLNQGRGISPDGKKLPFDEAHKVRVAPNNYVYEQPDGKHTFEINLPDGRNLKTNFPANASDQHTGDLAIFMGTLYAAESLNLAEPIFQRGWNITHGGTIDVHYDDIIKAKRLNEILVGGTAGHANRTIDGATINQMKHDFQAYTRRGDWATGDNDPERQREDFEELTILNADGTINWTQFEKSARYLQTKTSQGGIPDFEDLKRFMVGEEK